jgi:alginate O-acetyltransferase complex protein AlgI
MVFASPIFLFLFLPLVLAAYFVLPARLGNPVLLAASACFYFWGEGLYITLLLASITFNWLVGRQLATAGLHVRHRWLALGVGVNLAVLAIFKYANFAVANINTALGAMNAGTLVLAAIPLPLGISFFTFHSISYLIDIERRNATAQRRIGNFALYILMFPQLIAGPIIRYKDIATQIDVRRRDLADVAEGVRRFILGLGKKVLIANTLGRLADQIFALPAGDLHTQAAWIGLACYTLQIYFDFSGYSDMAIGLMRMFGFRVLENFNYPYVARSIREFWRRWHISLSNFFRDYLYIPLGGNQRGTGRAYLNLVIVFLLCGLWHGASWTFVLWGIWHGVFLVVERAGLGRVLENTWRPLQHFYAVAAIAGGWVLFRCDSLAHAHAYYTALGGGGAATSLRYPVPLLVDNLSATTLAVAVIGSMPVGPWLLAIVDQRTRVWRCSARAMELIWLASVFILSCAFLAAGTYNPFIYFRF